MRNDVTFVLQKNPLITPESLLLVSTLDGALYAVSKTSGQVQWMLNEGTCVPFPNTGLQGCLI